MIPPASDPTETLDPAFAAQLLDTLADTVPPTGETEAARAARRAALRIAFWALRPRTPTEAMLAAETIGAHHVIMDCYRRALLPGVDPVAAARARSSAATLSRGRLATLAALAKLQAAASPPATGKTPCTVAPADTAPILDGWTAHRRGAPTDAPASGYVPRDRTGAPIPDWKWEDMTMVQRRATYGEPGDVVLQAAAIAEEDAMIAAEAARPAAATAASP